MLFLSLLLSTSLAVLEADWSRFRGPNGSGLSDATGLPAEFGPTQNVIWKLELPEGFSSPDESGEERSGA